MILRGIMARRLVSLTILLLSMLAVAGTVVVVGFARVADVSRGSAGVLVLLGLVAIAVQSTESVRRREPEVALARLRGRRALSLLTFVVAEPVVVVVAGATVGLAVGWLLGRVAVSRWLENGATFRVDESVLVAAGAVTLACVLLVLVTCWSVVRAPLHRQLAAARRPRSASAATLFLQLALVLGAAVAGYQAHQAARSRVDWLTLLSPAVLGLAVGQVVVWLMLAVLVLLVPHLPSAGFGWFITGRRLLRRADSLALVRTVVAAGVVAAVAASAFTVAQGWREERARLQVGAPVSYPVPDGALRAYAAAETADPQGRWLLPAATLVGSSEGASRRMFVDTRRWGSVVGDFFADTPSAGLTTAFHQLSPERSVAYTRATEMTVVLDAAAIGAHRRLDLAVQYVNDSGDLHIIRLRLTGAGGVPVAGGQARFHRSVTDCSTACSVAQVDLEGSSPRHPVLLSDLTFGRQRLLAPSAGLDLLPGGLSNLQAYRVGTGVLIRRIGDRTGWLNILGTFDDPAAQPVVTTRGFVLSRDDGHPVVAGIDGGPRPVSVVARVGALPFVGTRGSALDLGSALAGSGGSVLEVRAAVLARADTPPTVLAALEATKAVRPPTTYAAMLGQLERTPRAEGTRLYLLLAGLAGLIALVSVTASAAQQVRERRLEAASLRTVGINAAVVLAAYRREALLLAAATFAGTAVGAWISCLVLLRALPLVSGWAFAPPPDVDPNPLIIGPTALAAAAAVAVVAYVALRGVGRSSPPRLLREDPS